MGRNQRILIVDDQEDLREQLAKLLVNHGHPGKTAQVVQSMRARLMGLDVATPEKPSNLPKYDIDVASQGQDAFEMVKAAVENKAPYAVMFTDMRMPPGWDGMETAQKVREIDKNIEIVIMTAYADYGQDEISSAIGTPEKLLYIKKPFQVEEIYQLALSLTAKWNFEELERTRRGWLENLIKCIRKVKLCGSGQNVQEATLDSLLSFTGGRSGFLGVLDETSGTWQLSAHRQIGETMAAEFIKTHADELKNSDTVQKNFHGLFLVPLTSNTVSAFVAINDSVPENDAEWFKLLNLLMMTSNENLEAVAFRKHKMSIETGTQNLLDIMQEIRTDAQTLKEKYVQDKSIDSALQKIDKALASIKQR